ncbi:tetratricopeptide repeat (TPR)-like superfamily protein [Actinidia rufa]|uniref:Tetratricopeptide repeat (TPR)-like superfamily protein n=1 Tax=Actinidia rufa TaxID=165716 RepID=A0A7J0H792_9ERIC|nr:tetratricopeptide repeat (TPR)-like superfamily protein [Actinidia rufa]
MPWATPLASQLPPIAAATTPATANRSSLPPLSAAAGKQCHPLPPQKLASLIENSKSISQLLRIHASLIRHGLDDHPILTFKLQCSYSSLNRLDYSVAVFNSTGNPDVFSYAAIIHAHSVKNLHQQALDLYVQMLTNYVDPNTFTFSAILKSCPLQLGKTIHSQALKFGIDSDTYVRTALVDVYARGGDLESARATSRLLFDGMEERDVVCWSVMINGYTQHGRPNEALALFRQMLGLKVKPSEATIVAVLSACGQLGALESGRWVHSYIVNNGIRFNVHVGTALVDMYSKCGSLEDASLVFDAIQDKDVVAWNSMIVGYAIHGFTEDALQLFTTMCGRGVHPTDITFIGILSACAHAGLVSEGWRFFHLMKGKYGIEPKIEHYGGQLGWSSESEDYDERQWSAEGARL